MSAEDPYVEVVKTALDHYPFEPTQIQFITRSEHITYRITTRTEESYLLRLKSRSASAENTIWQSDQAIASELLWLDALARDTDIPVQRPFPNTSGAFITTVVSEEGETFLCSVLGWIDADHPKQRGAGLANQLGSLVAQLHEHAMTWDIPDTFSRPDWTWQRMYRMVVSDLEKGVQIGTISQPNLNAADSALQRTRSTMASHPTDRDSWGIIHSDLHFDNYLVGPENQVIPIDFSACRFGHYLLDFAEALRFIKPEYHSEFVSGYKQIRPKLFGLRDELETFWVIGKLDNLSFLALNPFDYDHLSRTASESPDRIDDDVSSYISGEHFLQL